jgi:hypothetical protein
MVGKPKIKKRNKHRIIQPTMKPLNLRIPAHAPHTSSPHISSPLYKRGARGDLTSRDLARADSTTSDSAKQDLPKDNLRRTAKQSPTNN